MEVVNLRRFRDTKRFTSEDFPYIAESLDVGLISEIIIIGKMNDGTRFIAGNVTAKDANEIFSDFISSPKKYLE